MDAYTPMLGTSGVEILPIYNSVFGEDLLHFQTNETVTIIGEDLGVLKYKDLGVAKIRVEVNGLRTLKMTMESSSLQMFLLLWSSNT